jgi:RND family efflux transporter MFP subunit
MKAKYLKTISIVVLVSFFGCSDAPAEKSSQEQDLIAVTVAKVSADGDQAHLSVSGTVASKNAAQLSTRVMGHVERVNVNIGDRVSKGQLLISINSADLKAKKAQVNAGISEAKAAYDIAEKDFNRFKKLFDQNSASQKELDDITAHYNMAKARYEAALQMRNEIDAQFAYTNVIAPFNGIITARFIDAGDLANPGMPLLAIEAPDDFEVVARVPESSISKIEKGLRTKVMIPSIETAVSGNVSKVSASSANSGGQYVVKIDLEESNKKMRSGMFVTVNFPSIKNDSAHQSGTVLIPRSIVIERGGLTGIYTVSQQETAVLRWLRLGKTIGDQVEVLSGLKADETYILDTEGKLYNGAKLTIQY